MKTTHHDVLECPVCHGKLDASSDPLGDATPGPGDVTVCIQCGSVLMYGDGLTLTQTWDPEILDHPTVIAVVEAWKKMKGVE